jgi:hypothetical protein
MIVSMERREFLGIVGAGALIGTAGCFQGGDSTASPDGTPTFTDETSTVTSTPPESRELSVGADETHRIQAGETETYESVDLGGTLTVGGTLTLT